MNDVKPLSLILPLGADFSNETMSFSDILSTVGLTIEYPVAEAVRIAVVYSDMLNQNSIAPEIDFTYLEYALDEYLPNDPMLAGQIWESFINTVFDIYSKIWLSVSNFFRTYSRDIGLPTTGSTRCQDAEIRNVEFKDTGIYVAMDIHCHRRGDFTWKPLQFRRRKSVI